MENRVSREEPKQGGVNNQAEVQAAPEAQMSPNEGYAGKRRRPEENRKGLAKSIWVLALLVALLCASSVVSITISRKAYESSRRNAEAVTKLDDSLRELRKSVVRLTKAIEEFTAREEEGEAGETPPAWNGRI
jgi:uncharacterized protein YlxW (UPF0749 family)